MTWPSLRRTPVGATARRAGPLRRVPCARGFTLLEVVVVVAIIGILVGFAIVTLPRMGGDAQLEEQVRRLTALIELASEEAVLQGRDLGLYMDLHGYDFHQFDPEALSWVPLQGDDLFRAREVGDDISFELVVEGRDAKLLPKPSDLPPRPAALGEEDADDDDGDEAAPAVVSNVTPQVLILASGELTPFTLIIDSETAKHRWIMTGQPYGAVELEQEELF